MKQKNNLDFLPATPEEMQARGWDELDFLLVSGDAYVDHPSFGAAIIGRVLEAEGYRIGMLAQPDVSKPDSFAVFGRPRFGVLISGGVVDSMVAHYTVAKRRRQQDEYSPGGKPGKRPDRVVDVYTALAKRAFPGLPVVAGGVEASLRRFAHYDYWEDAVRPSILETSGADLVSFGMGERSIREIARRLAMGQAVEQLHDIPGVAYLTDFAGLPASYAECASFKKVSTDKAAYAKACAIQMDNQDIVNAKPVVQKQTERYLVQNLPAAALNREELDAVYALPFTRRWHPMYDKMGGVPALDEVEFSIIHNRGCYGGCHFCAITLHQGRRVTSRSAASVLAEAEQMTKAPGFKGYIHDVGGPTANFRGPSCAKQAKEGICKGSKHCLAPSPCPKLIVTHTEYLAILRKMRALPGVKRVFIRSGIRYDYLMHDKDDAFFRELVEHHVSGQLKVAPEHCSPGVLRAMGKPPISVYEAFAKRFYQITKEVGKEQYLVPYLISSHPGSTLRDAAELALWLHKNNIRPEQVQDFYPTPGTVSTCMYYTGLDPYTGKPVYVSRDAKEKAQQRALLQPRLPQNQALARQGLKQAGREDLIPLLVLGRAAADTADKQRQGSGKSATGKKQPAGRRAGKNTPGRNTETAGNSKGGVAGRNKTSGRPAQAGKQSRGTQGKTKHNSKTGGAASGSSRPVNSRQDDRRPINQKQKNKPRGRR